MKILVFEIFEKGQILWPFSGLEPLNWKFFPKNLMVAYVHIEYSTYQFSKESKLRYRKKRGPERVKQIWALLMHNKCICKLIYFSLFRLYFSLSGKRKKGNNLQKNFCLGV